MVVPLTRWTCCWCKTEQAMPTAANEVLLASAGMFYCIYGHSQKYTPGPTEEELLQKQLDAERQARQRAEQNAAYEADLAASERRRASAYKGHATRITKRAKSGICPCCNRHFTALERHMATKHPQFTPLEVEAVTQ